MADHAQSHSNVTNHPAAEQSKLEKAITEAVDQWDALDARRKQANDKKKALIEGLVAQGIHRDAFRLVMRYRELDENARRHFDLSMMTVRKTLAQPMQLDFLQEVNVAANLMKLAEEGKKSEQER